MATTAKKATKKKVDKTKAKLLKLKSKLKALQAANKAINKKHTQLLAKETRAEKALHAIQAKADAVNDKHVKNADAMLVIEDAIEKLLAPPSAPDGAAADPDSGMDPTVLPPTPEADAVDDEDLETDLADTAADTLDGDPDEGEELLDNT